MKTQQVTWKGKFFLDRQKLVLRSAKKRGHTQCNKQYTQKKPTQAPENKDKNLEKSKGSHNIESPENSDERGFPHSATVWTTPQGI